ncbi:hypothetical protein H6G74_16305 [Nostoc spongiaeforme FACHB-130]|uniref:Uncharacterized protein n=1 Tax=Nostoc spongiaeforme FACHB-130 TaxID=1357510 RepID=A0ABR8FX26_9NOSO|nr:hypothetical protein [Nostoc spongiaeforme]MBD2595881.1 hypothetical protein [Nostoc spongiaeforme FACHB-130]
MSVENFHLETISRLGIDSEAGVIFVAEARMRSLLVVLSVGFWNKLHIFAK